MIDLYTWPTPNGRKVSIALEEMGLEYQCHAVNLQEQAQFKPEFLAISPNNKIPALVDHNTGQSLMESGAILIYLADKCGESLIQNTVKARRFAKETLFGIDRLTSVVLFEIMHLPEHRAQSTHLPHQPLQGGITFILFICI